MPKVLKLEYNFCEKYRVGQPYWALKRRLFGGREGSSQGGSAAGECMKLAKRTVIINVIVILGCFILFAAPPGKTTQEPC